MPQHMRPLTLALRALLAPVLIALLFVAAPRILNGPPTAHAAAGEVLILDSTVTGGTTSLEAQEVVAAGKTPVLVSPATWATMTTADFAAYDAIVLGDPTCTSINSTPIAAAEANAAVWGAAVDGNVVVIGTDPAYHSALGVAGATNLTQKGIAFAVADSTKTGAYIALSCYYAFSASGTAVPMLDGAFGGSFTVVGQGGGCPNASHIVATHPALNGLTDADLSNWTCSTHEGFNSWPSPAFDVLAINTDVASSYVAPDGTNGAPYIIARGVQVISDIKLTPTTATNPVGSTHTVTATVTTDQPTAGTPVAGATVSFSVISGPNAGKVSPADGTCSADATCKTDANGQVSWTYPDTGGAGTDVIKATFASAPGITQTSNLVEKIWQPVTCPNCDETQVTVDSNVTVDFNPVLKGKPPTCDDGVIHDLCLYFSWDTSGPTPDTWKAIFDVGQHKLVIKDNVIVTTLTVPLTGTQRAAPGIVIKGTCEIVVEGDTDHNGKPARVVVTSQNLKAGDILIQFDGNVTIDGQVRDEVQGTLGKPGKITIASCCGDITTGPQSRIETIGVDPGGSDINILTCCARGYGGAGGDIVINGLVRAVHKSGTTPTINIVAFVGAVTIDGTNDLGDVAGSSLRRTSGVLVETLNATDGGDINIQAQDTVTVKGNRVLFTNRTNYGAVAIKTNNTNGQGGNGAMKVVSVGGSILASDRAFDFANRFNHTSNTFITLLAKGDVSLSVTAVKNAGAADNTKAVVTSQGGAGGQGGTNTLRGYDTTANVIIGLHAQVLANAPGGANGKNLLISCAGVLNSGTVNPADAFPGDDSGTCSPPAPAPLFASCDQLGVVFTHDGQTGG